MPSSILKRVFGNDGFLATTMSVMVCRLTTKRAYKVFTKFHIVDLVPTSLRVKKLSVLDLAQVC